MVNKKYILTLKILLLLKKIITLHLELKYVFSNNTLIHYK